jgi:hypothetical protein
MTGGGDGVLLERHSDVDAVDLHYLQDEEDLLDALITVGVLLPRNESYGRRRRKQAGIRNLTSCSCSEDFNRTIPRSSCLWLKPMRPTLLSWVLLQQLQLERLDKLEDCTLGIFL